MAPMSRATSTGGLGTEPAGGMVLKVTATSPAAKMAASRVTASLPSRRKKVEALDPGRICCTWATFGPGGDGLLRASSSSGAASAG